MSNIGNKIKELRKRNNLSQQELGDKLFVSDKTISSWESNRTLPDIDMLLKICNVFKINLFSLVSNFNPNTTETEVKVKVDSSEYDRVLELIKKRATYLNTEEQQAVYFKPPHRNMNNEWLRIRTEGNKKVLCLKQYIDGKSCKEYEVIIDNDENLKQIFKCLDFEEIATVNKTRIKYLFQDKYEFAFDTIKDLGTFIEIEVKKYDLDPIEEYNNLLRLLYEFNIDLSLISTKRYPEYFIK